MAKQAKDKAITASELIQDYWEVSAALQRVSEEESKFPAEVTRLASVQISQDAFTKEPCFAYSHEQIDIFHKSIDPVVYTPRRNRLHLELDKASAELADRQKQSGYDAYQCILDELGTIKETALSNLIRHRPISQAEVATVAAYIVRSRRDVPDWAVDEWLCTVAASTQPRAKASARKAKP